MKIPVQCISLLALVMSVYPVTSCAELLSSRCTIAMYTNTLFQEPVNSFSIYQKAYLRVFCNVLPVGSYNITTQWIDGEGGLQAEHAQEFEINFPRYHASTFKFKQMPKGMVNRLFSGKDFEEHQFGRWSVLTFINNEQIGRKYFTITAD